MECHVQICATPQKKDIAELKMLKKWKTGMVKSLQLFLSKKRNLRHVQFIKKIINQEMIEVYKIMCIIGKVHKETFQLIFRSLKCLS